MITRWRGSREAAGGGDRAGCARFLVVVMHSQEAREHDGMAIRITQAPSLNFTAAMMMVITR